MKSENFLKKSEQIFTIIDKYNDLIGSEADVLKQELSIDSTENLREMLVNLENTGRLLQIGIVGRVKAGKSSLLNGLLFDGQSILPKAATPMTAALTILSYGEELSAEVEFFTREDIENISQNSRKYIEKLQNLSDSNFDDMKKNRERKSGKLSQDELTELSENAKKLAKKELSNDLELSASFDQLEDIKRAKISIESLGERQVLIFKNLSDLQSKLRDYVGVDGNFTPFTKIVHIKLPLKNIEGLQIVDTPGINDSVQSREKRTRELLKTCDVVFIVSPTGQFLSIQDQELMDRISSKEGIRELFMISSQVDTQLFGSEKSKYKGDLRKILSGIVSNLGGHMSSTLTKLKQNNPEVGRTFDQLISQGEDRVVHSSGICQTIKLYFDERNKWDDGVKKVWENLTTNYPDYFSDGDKTLSISNLDLLSNISHIKKSLADIKSKKSEILEKRKSEFIEAKFNSLLKFKDGLHIYTHDLYSRIKDNSLDEIKKQKTTLEKVQKKASAALNEEYADLVDELNIKIRGELINSLNSIFSDTKKKVDGAEETKSESYTIDKGAGFFWWREIFGERYEERSRSFQSVRTGAVRDALENLTMDIENAISTKSQDFIHNWKKNLNSQLIKVLRGSVDDDDLEPNLIRSSIREVLNLINYPELEYGEYKFRSDKNGTLRDNAAENFMEMAKEYINNFKRLVHKDINDYNKTLVSSLKSFDPSTRIFGSYKERIKELEEQIKTKKVVLSRIEKLVVELEMIKK